MLAFFLSFLIKYDWTIPSQYNLLLYIPIFLLIKVTLFFIFRLYTISWRFISTHETIDIVKALFLSTLCVLLVNFLVNPGNAYEKLSLSLVLFDFILSLLFVCSFRFSKRVYFHIINEYSRDGKGMLVIGAGSAGELIARDMRRHSKSQYTPIGFVDDNINKKGSSIQGIKVLGTTADIPKLTNEFNVESILIAIPSATSKEMRRIMAIVRKTEIKDIKVVPDIRRIIENCSVTLADIREINIEDVIGREQVSVDYQEIGNFVLGKTVLLTGAGGSIGSEIVMQVCVFHPEEVILFDIDETELHNLGLKLNRLFPHLSGQIHYITGDVRDEMRLKEVFEAFKPQIIFHAAAYKHVPMMEFNPKEAVKVNIFGTYNLARVAVDYGVEKFIMISTDKAVRPTSIMGATKRMAEYVCKAFNDDRGQGSGVRGQDETINHSTRFISVRFGNVLGSRGSVLPLFLDQLKHGGPLTVTHKDMKRYFMTIPEAVSLVLQASTMGEGGEVFVLDMGEPVKIIDIAEELIRIHGLEPNKDIDITFIGLRPGEKLFEEILTAEEGTMASKHEKVFIAKNSEKYSIEKIEGILKEFRELISESSIGNDGKVKELLKKYVKHYEETANQ
ncbi:MAG: nucleoside-diphosphate sugar epimerase/dehydratase [Proteobacteria bacterium]|nr:nucleoside-diphosphate sugar epimerase/dehydratase [Pseudomonadota bacterium]